MNENIIETNGLTVYYGHHPGIIDVDLQVQTGEVFGFLGPNGAGKTTAQRVLLDVIRPTSGSATIFGLDCQRQGISIRERTGYLPGELSLYPGMKAHAFLCLLASLRANVVDDAFRLQLYERLNLDPTRKMKTYSRGNKQKVGIIAAFMGKPDLLVLDEPTSGLDPLMQQVVLELVQEAKDEGRTVFFSSHNLPEVQAVCDRVGIIREGRLIKTEQVETLTKQQFKRLKIRFRELPPTDIFSTNGVTETGRDGKVVTLEIGDGLDKVMELAARYGIEDIETLPVSLEEIFLAFYEGRHEGVNHA
ncbi:MAG: ABC transporter ATP-binding protein [Candidatus Hydrogenedentota bacterium]